jgi:hypothetical protein
VVLGTAQGQLIFLNTHTRLATHTLKLDEGQREVTQLKEYAIPDHRILMVACANSVGYCFEVGEEEPRLARVLAGGHLGSPVLCVAYDACHGLAATGSENGRLAIWELSTSKLETSASFTSDAF